MPGTGEEGRVPGNVTLADGYVPVIDMRHASSDDPDARAVLAGAILAACRSSGFFIVAGHGVPRVAIDEVLRESKEFFALPQGEKLALLADPSDPLMRGFSWPGRPREDLGSAGELLVKPDLCESWVMNRLGEDAAIRAMPADADARLRLPNKMPAMPRFQAAFRAYYAEMERLAMKIMRLFATGLELPEQWFDDKFDNHMTSLAVNFYPAQVTPPASGQLRKGAHTDWGTVTVLYHDESTSGLQVWHESREWVDVPVVPGTFVVNIGDLMAQWTNGTWTSTVHRVVNPSREDAPRPRYSVAFFHQPNHDAVIKCIPSCEDPAGGARHRPVTSFGYLSGKARRAYLEERMINRGGGQSG